MREIEITVRVPDHVDSEQVWEIARAAQEWVSENFAEESADA